MMDYVCETPLATLRALFRRARAANEKVLDQFADTAAKHDPTMMARAALAGAELARAAPDAKPAAREGERRAQVDDTATCCSRRREYLQEIEDAQAEPKPAKEGDDGA